MAQTVIVYTDSQRWGKGETLNQAKKSAEYKRSNKVVICVIDAPQDKVSINADGSINYPEESTYLTITDGWEKI